VAIALGRETRLCTALVVAVKRQPFSRGVAAVKRPRRWITCTRGRGAVRRSSVMDRRCVGTITVERAATVVVRDCT
jgi:hypothetical protein